LLQETRFAGEISFFMENFSTIDRPNYRISSQRMAGFGLVALMVATALLTNGCGKGKSSTAQALAQSPVADTNQAPAVIQQALPPASAPVVVAVSPDGGADLKQLNHAYIDWVMQNRRRPTSFEEFVKLSGIQVPPPPAGKKYVIDGHGFINYVNN
jgi:hypothetical protein